MGNGLDKPSGYIWRRTKERGDREGKLLLGRPERREWSGVKLAPWMADNLLWSGVSQYSRRAIDFLFYIRRVVFLFLFSCGVGLVDSSAALPSDGLRFDPQSCPFN